MIKGYVTILVEPLMVSHHLAMFGSLWFSANGDITNLICHMASQNHVVEGSCNFMSWTTYK